LLVVACFFTTGGYVLFHQHNYDNYYVAMVQLIYNFLFDA